MIHAINYKPGFYGGTKPYRDCLAAALQHFGLTKFNKGAELWTLGGKEWYEYKFLVESGIKFGPGTYHNVDFGEIDPLNDTAVVAHRGVDFMNIWEIWQKPRALCFDSTAGLVANNECVWMQLIQLGIAAAKSCGKTSLNWNFLTGYGNLLFDKTHEKTVEQSLEELFTRYESWLAMLVDNVQVRGLNIDFFDKCVLAPKQRSTTAMISGHCLLS
jgi:hypothetical protein